MYKKLMKMYLQHLKWKLLDKCKIGKFIEFSYFFIKINTNMKNDDIICFRYKRIISLEKEMMKNEKLYKNF